MKTCGCGCGQPTAIAARNDLRAGWIKGQPKRFVSGHNSRNFVSKYTPYDGPTKFCECGCGQPTKFAVKSSTRTGWVQGQPKRFLAGHAGRVLKFNVRHGMCRSPEAIAYVSAKQRCINPNKKCWLDYGGRGIKFLFTSFEQFFAELGARPVGKSLDRIDNDAHYEPGNVRWATRTEQIANRRPYKRKAPQSEHIQPGTAIAFAQLAV